MSTTRILCIGDSHTAGFPGFDPAWGGNVESSYEYWLEKLLSQEYEDRGFLLSNEGICGQTTREVLARYIRLLNTNRFDLTIFWAGANDLAIGLPHSEIRTNILKSKEIARSHNIPTIIVNIPPMGWSSLYNDINNLNSYIHTLEDEFCKPADIHSKLGDSKNLHHTYDSGDGVHLSPEGYREVANVLFDCITQIFAR
ncbi:MAG: SGNH/GDSL hydrolase family protein [Candidatus Hodarchaeales archaeon]